ncbi:hypothetical protein BDK51DRAFT_38352 [Blyttiomyces helicus]|uniref:Uncharacterized protein n=1 Tax=Blyttiomyces helicus TaxID=388810 RepID=A0A4V1IPV9_9FUNG|nr:hypothetical protein BDK51DRAFT_38352 [Blyttiomyces helicus]|eukprot:RKO84417.1 hypothetical protein BDK51DRAFT_38352 [Blyttiomyces helicus]
MGKNDGELRQKSSKSAPAPPSLHHPRPQINILETSSPEKKGVREGNLCCRNVTYLAARFRVGFVETDPKPRGRVCGAFEAEFSPMVVAELCGAVEGGRSAARLKVHIPIGLAISQIPPIQPHPHQTNMSLLSLNGPVSLPFMSLNSGNVMHKTDLPPPPLPAMFAVGQHGLRSGSGSSGAYVRLAYGVSQVISAIIMYFVYRKVVAANVESESAAPDHQRLSLPYLP